MATWRTDGLGSAVSRTLEAMLIAIGILSLGYFAYVSAESALYQAFEDQELDAILAERPAPSTTAPRPAPRRTSVVGRIEIPRLEVAAIVRAGSDARTLQLAVGHIPGTALPGETGNVGLAGHRDTFFRRLRNIRSDDEIRVTTPDGTYVYQVARTDIVQPNDIWVLDPTAAPTLTLVTCYPFSYVGSAPKRFVVRANLVRELTSNGRTSS
jgi:sortase A